MERLELRELTTEDLPQMQQLVRLDARNVHQDELARFLALEGAHALGVARDGRLAGMVTVMRYFEHAWLGPIVTESGDDAVGIGLALAQDALRRLSTLGLEHVEAEATPSEEVMLEKLGFHRIRSTVVMERPASAGEAVARAGSTESLDDRHLLDVGALDAAAVGYGRKQYISDLARAFPEGARAAVDAAQEVRGYALMRRARRGYALGPLVTVPDALELAEDLLGDAVAAAPTWPIVALAPQRTALTAALERLGFVAVGELSRMRAGGPARDADARGATEWLLGSRMTG